MQACEGRKVGDGGEILPGGRTVPLRCPPPVSLRAERLFAAGLPQTALSGTGGTAQEKMTAFIGLTIGIPEGFLDMLLRIMI